MDLSNNFSGDFSNAGGADIISSAINLISKTDAQKDTKAMCGRKPVFPITKKAKAQKKAYDSCVAGLRNPSPQTGGDNTPPPPAPEKSHTGLYVGIGVGVLVITALIIFRKRIF